MYAIRSYYVDKVKAISHNQFGPLCKENPNFKRIHSIVWSFKNLLETKDYKGLEDWMFTASELKVREITSFVNGLKRAIDAVSNAIKYEYSNGLAEGSVNKLKVIKRIMYGRCSFEILKLNDIGSE